MVPLLLLPGVLGALQWSEQPWAPLDTGGGAAFPLDLPRAPHKQPQPLLVQGRSKAPPRRRWRRRRRYFRDPRVYSRAYRSYRSSSRRRQQRRVDAEEGRGFVSSFRNLFGAPEHCLEGGRQYSCTFAPVCWLTGGVVSQGSHTN